MAEGTENDEGWESLPGVQRGMYNLLELVDGHDTLLVDAMIPSGKIHQLRLVLGDENWITINGEDHALKTPSAQQSGLKLNINADVVRSEEHTSELQSLMRISYAVFCLKKKK